MKQLTAISLARLRAAQAGDAATTAPDPGGVGRAEPGQCAAGRGPRVRLRQLARGDDGGTALHAAAYSGSASAVRLLLDRGADVEARDATWDSTPIEWAAVGSGEQPGGNPRPDWIGTVQALLDAGASARDIALSPDDPKPPSPEVAALLRRHTSAPPRA